MRFDNFLNESQVENDAYLLIEYMVLMDEFESLNESSVQSGGIAGKIDKALGALGLHAQGSNKGLIQMMIGAGKDVALLFWYAMKAMKGDKEAKAKAEEIAKKEVKKEDVVDFLLKLDTLTMHMFTGPIHMIDALTGWHIAPQIQKKTKDLTHRVDRALTHLEKIKQEVAKPVAKKLNQYISGIRKTFVTDGIK